MSAILARLPNLEFLIDPRFQAGVEGKALGPRIPDLSPAGTNYMDNGSVVCAWLASGINNRPAFDMYAGGASVAPMSRVTLTRPLLGAQGYTIIMLAQLRSPVVNCIFGAEYANAPLIAYNSGLRLQTGAGPSILGAGAASPNVPFILTGIFNGANSVIRLNRAVLASGALDVQDVPGFRIGSVFGGGANADCRLGPCGIYRGVMRQVDIDYAEASIDREYALGLGPN